MRRYSFLTTYIYCMDICLEGPAIARLDSFVVESHLSAGIEAFFG